MLRQKQVEVAGSRSQRSQPTFHSISLVCHQLSLLLPKLPALFCLFVCFLIFFSMFYLFLGQRETEHERGRGREGGRRRIGNRLQSLSCKHRARRGARTPGPRDHDLSGSRMLNRLSHPGTPLLPEVFPGGNAGDKEMALIGVLISLKQLPRQACFPGAMALPPTELHPEPLPTG